MQEDAPLEAPSRRKRRAFFVAAINPALVSVSLLAVAVPAEFVLRQRYAHMIRTPRAEVMAVQQYLTLDPVIGFKWRPDISAERGIRFSINDMTTPALSTDSFGVINAPDAIALRAAGRPIDVVGLGDSFMEMAAAPFHDRFKKLGLAYYSLAIHRQCPPQYGAILKSWAAELKPRAVLYGLFENDFEETADYGSWRSSGVDWFAYHSGTWCGPPIGVSAIDRFLHTHARGWNAFGRVLLSKVRGERISVSGPADRDMADVTASIRDAAAWADAAGVRFILVIIPSKQTAAGSDTRESRAYDAVLAALGNRSIEVVDLRAAFRSHPDPASLYYVVDGHWNAAGVALAGDEILKRFEGAANESGSH